MKRMGWTACWPSREALPERLHDTAYAAAFEVAAVDLEMRMEEVRVLQLFGASSISTR